VSARRRVAPLIVLIGVAGVGVWLFRDRDGPAAPAAGSRPTDAPPAAGVAAPGHTAEPAAESTPVTLVPLPDAAPPASGDAVVFVRVKGPDGMAVAGVPVAFVARVQGDDVPLRVVDLANSGAAGEPARLELQPALFGDVWDKGGTIEYSVVVAMPLPGAPVSVLAQRPLPGQTFELSLPEQLASWCRPLDVRVFDSQGEPVPHVPLQLVARSEPPSDAPAVIERAATSEHGIANIDLAGFWAAAWHMRLMDMKLVPLVRTEVPFRTPVEAVLRTDREAPARVELRLPGAGWLDVYVADSDGQPVPAAALAVRWEIASGRQAGSGRFDARVLEDGIARIGPLALGWLLTVDAADMRSRVGFTATDVAGPMAIGDVSSLAVRLPPAGKLLFAGRLVDADGASLGGLRCTAELRPPGEPEDAADSSLVEPDVAASALVEPDADGRFAFDFALPQARVDDALAGRLELVLTELLAPPPTGPARVATVSLQDAQVTDDRLDLGDLVLRVPPDAPPWVHLKGRVTDASGQPVVSAFVEVFPLDDATGNRGPRLIIGRTENDGSYAFDFEQPNGKIELVAAQKGFAVARRSGSVAELQDVVLVLGPGGS
jgi:hypothetical protein